MPERKELVSTPPSRAGGPEAVRSAYQSFMQKQDPKLQFITPQEIREKYGAQNMPDLGDVAIVGAGMAGLKAAMDIRELDLGNVTMFEADDRIGGRLFTHFFDKKKTVYFEAGGMRIPESHRRVKSILKFLESKGRGLSTIPYVMENTASRVFVNGKRNDGTAYTLQEVRKNPNVLVFGPQNTSADDKLALVMNQYVQILKQAQMVSEEAFQAAFEDIVRKYDNLSLRQFLQEKAEPRWTEQEIVFVESMSDQTNAYHVSFVEQLMDSFEFAATEWYAIKGGMQKLPEACLKVCEDYNKGAEEKRFRIHMSTCLKKIETVEGTEQAATAEEPSTSDTKKVKLHLRDSKNQTMTHDYDRVLLAIPQAALRMIETPEWSPDREYAIRALQYGPIRKIGLMFKTRWWEHLPKNPIKGGQSITDLPSRWVVFPSDEDPTGGTGPGALLCYAWSNDANVLLSLPPSELEGIALRDLNSLHGDQVEVEKEFLRSYHVEWSLKRAGGIAFFLPGQWKDVFGKSLCPEGNVYFAGEHLSKHHAWVEGALDSAQQAVQQMGSDELRRGPASYDITQHGSRALFADVL